MSKNQCDGCRAGWPLNSWNHHYNPKLLPGQYSNGMACCADMYTDTTDCTFELIEAELADPSIPRD